MGTFNSFNAACVKSKQAGSSSLRLEHTSDSDNLKFTTQTFNTFQGEHYHLKTFCKEKCVCTKKRHYLPFVKRPHHLHFYFCYPLVLYTDIFFKMQIIFLKISSNVRFYFSKKKKKGGERIFSCDKYVTTLAISWVSNSYQVWLKKKEMY